MHTKSRKTNIKLLLLTFIVFAAFYIISVTSSKTAFATDPTDADTANFTVTSTRTLTLSLSNTNVSLNLTPSATGEFSSTASNPLTITVSTNNDTGFNLNMTTTTTNLTRTTPLSGSFPVIETLGSSGSITATEFAESASTTNKWGYSLDGTNFNPVTTSKSILSRTTADIDGSPTTANLTFGVKLNNSIPQGDYKTTLNFIATAYPIDATFDNAFSIAGKHTVTYNDKEYYRMQDMSPWICSMVASPADTTEETTETTQLIDIRDNKVYWVAKLLDGNCWMTQNLDLDLSPNITLTHEDTDLGWATGSNRQSWRTNRNATSQFSYTSSTVPGWAYTNGAPVSASIYGNTTSDAVYAVPVLDSNSNFVSSLQSCTATGLTSQQCEHYEVGNYYNFPAIAAQNNFNVHNYAIGQEIPDSICPAGWKLPSGTAVQQNGETVFYSDYNNLYTLYGAISDPFSSEYLPNGARIIQTAPLYFILAGDINGQSEFVQAGVIGTYFAALKNKDGSIMTSVFYAKTFSDWIASTPASSSSVRCIAR
ncbi:hypothetical protein IKG68_00330 [Candidatus Saccharibacteria bacterium]|nr:hypothetical protein [Candidatus Saccharibacteria bacterium]